MAQLQQRVILNTLHFALISMSFVWRSGNSRLAIGCRRTWPFSHRGRPLHFTLDSPELPAWSHNPWKWFTETVYIITSLTPSSGKPAEIGAWIRGHWAIENGLHYRRDVNWCEDHSQVRNGEAPRVMAPLRNIAITILRLQGETNLAKATRAARKLPRPSTQPSQRHYQLNDFAAALEARLGAVAELRACPWALAKTSPSKTRSRLALDATAEHVDAPVALQGKEEGYYGDN